MVGEHLEFLIGMRDGLAGESGTSEYGCVGVVGVLSFAIGMCDGGDDSSSGIV